MERDFDLETVLERRLGGGDGTMSALALPFLHLTILQVLAEQQNGPTRIQQCQQEVTPQVCHKIIN